MAIAAEDQCVWPLEVWGAVRDTRSERSVCGLQANDETSALDAHVVVVARAATESSDEVDEPCPPQREGKLFGGATEPSLPAIWQWR